MTKRKFDEEESCESALDKELEEMKSSKEWQNMDKSERRRFRNMLIARRTRLRFKTEINELKKKMEELSTINLSLLSQVSSTIPSSIAAADLVRNDFNPPKIVVDVMRNLCGSNDFQSSAFCVMSSVSPKGSIVYATDAFVRMTGYTRSELIGKPGLFLCEEEDAASMIHSLAFGRDFEATLNNYRKNGEKFQNYIRFVNLRDQKGRTFLVVAQCKEDTSLCKSFCSRTRVPDILRPQHVAIVEDCSSLSNGKLMNEYRTPTNMEGTFSPIKLAADADPVTANFQDIGKIMDTLPLISSVDDMDVLNCPSFDFLSSAQVY